MPQLHYGKAVAGSDFIYCWHYDAGRMKVLHNGKPFHSLSDVVTFAEQNGYTTLVSNEYHKIKKLDKFPKPVVRSKV